MAKVSLKNKRYCWVARETAKGWKLEFHHGNKHNVLSGAEFHTLQDVSNALFIAPFDDMALVIVWMDKNPKRNREDKKIFAKVENIK